LWRKKRGNATRSALPGAGFGENALPLELLKEKPLEIPRDYVIEISEATPYKLVTLGRDL
jgi:hypothetical protein